MSIHDDKNIKALYKRDTHKNWQTPWWFYKLLDKKHHFIWDMAASSWNALCKNFVTEKQNALSMEWPGNTAIFCNPPYDSRSLGKWFERGWDAAKRDSDVVFLVHGRVDTAWFHDWAVRGTVCFVRGRLKFLFHGKKLDPAPFPSVVVVFNKKHIERYNKYGIDKEMIAYTIDAREKMFRKFPRKIKRFPR